MNAASECYCGELLPKQVCLVCQLKAAEQRAEKIQSALSNRNEYIIGLHKQLVAAEAERYRAVRALAKMIGWAKSAEECGYFYFTEEQPPNWKADLAEAESALSPVPVPAPTKETENDAEAALKCRKCNAEMQSNPATIYCPICDKLAGPAPKGETP